MIQIVIDHLNDVLENCDYDAVPKYEEQLQRFREYLETGIASSPARDAVRNTIEAYKNLGDYTDIVDLSWSDPMCLD